MRRRRGQGPHLVEVGVRWPPETFVGWKLEGLAARGMRVTVASRSVFDPEARLRGVELVPIPPRPTGARAARRAILGSLGLLVTAPRRFVRLLRGVRRHVPPTIRRRRYGGILGALAMWLPLARLKPDVVHFEWHTAAVDHLPLFDVWGCPIVTSCRGSDTAVYPHVPGFEDYATRLPEVLRRAAAVHCVADSQKREAVELGLDPARAWVVRPAVDPALFRLASDASRPLPGTDDEVLRVVMVGWLRWEKGHEYALQALASLRRRGVPASLEMVGSVPEEWRGRYDERARILHTVAELGLEAHVDLHGVATSAEVSGRLQASDLLLHASVTEGIPNAIVEAMACGLPVVATHCGGVPEVVTHGTHGLLVPPREPERLADAVEELWRDPERRRSMGEAGRAAVRAGLTLEHEHGAFLEMYREVVAASRAA